MLKNIAPPVLSTTVVFIAAIACGSVVANLYYAQTIIALIGHSLNLNLQLTGLIVTITQIGYGLGLLFVVPLADILENKRLILGLLALSFLFLLSMIFTHSSSIFILSCLFLGLSAVSVQIIVPFVAHFTPLEKRGLVVGRVMSGLLFGIMLARPIASFIADMFSWRAVFIFSAILMVVIALLLYFAMPTRTPEHKLSYKKLLYSLPVILKYYPILQRRAVYHAALFGIFSLFWSAIAMLLMGKLHYSQAQVALFAFVGAMGAFVAPIAGRIADRGWSRIATGIAIIMVGIACLISIIGKDSISMLVVAALLLDAGVSCNLVLGQRAIFAIAPEIRSRLNGLYMAIFFIGGAIGSGLSGYLYAHGGWNYIAYTGIGVSIGIFIYFLGEYFAAVEKRVINIES